MDEMNDQEKKNSITGTVLIVDDDPDIREVITEILKSRGFEVREAENGVRALESVKADLPDLILLDIRLPDIDGFEACRRLRMEEKSSKVPIIFLSGLSDTNDIVRAFSSGGSDYIIKPFKEKELISRIENHLERSRIQIQLQDKNLELEREIAERKRVVNELRQSEEKYMTMVVYSNDMIWTLDKNGNFTYINKKSEEITGYKIKEALSKGFVPIILEEDLEMVFDVFRKTLKGNPQHYEVRIHDASRKKQITLSVNTAPIYKDEEIIGTVSFGRDITERKRVENELRKSENRLRTIIECLPFDFFLLDENSRYIMINATCREHWGDIIGKRPIDICPDSETLEIWRRNNQRAFNGEVVRGEEVVHMKEGDKYIHNIISPVKNEQAIQGIVGVNIDVTELTWIKERLEKTSEAMGKLAKLVSECPNPIMRISKKGLILYANKESSIVLETWKCQVGQHLPQPFLDRVRSIYESGHESEFNLDCSDGSRMRLTLNPDLEENYLNVYGVKPDSI
jgi:PAS domain S-box-containing protein